MSALDDVALSDESLVEDEDDGMGNEDDWKMNKEDDSDTPQLKEFPGKSMPESRSSSSEDDEVPLAKRPRFKMDSPFHGFLPSEVPKKKVIIQIDENSEEYDLTIPFDFKLLCDEDSNDGSLNKTETDLKDLKGKIESEDKESNDKTESDDKESNGKTDSDAQSNELEKSVSEPPAKRPCIESVLQNTSAKPDIISPLPALSPPSAPSPIGSGQQRSAARSSQKAAAAVSPLVRESREWKPSAQFFKPLAAGWVREVIYDRDANGDFQSKPKEIVYYAPYMPGTKPRKFKALAELGTFLSSAVTEFTLNNFSFRKEPMNAAKGQEICRATDEEIEIFPSKCSEIATTPTAARRKSVQNEQQQQTDASAKVGGTTTPTGLLKVKVFSRMREENIASGSPKSPIVKNPEQSVEKKQQEEDPVELVQKTIFEKPGMKLKISFPSSPPVSSTATLSTPTVTITPAVKPSPSIVIEPTRPSSQQRGNASNSTPTSVPRRQVPNKMSKPSSQQQQIMQQPAKSRILRPPKMAPVNCSIHCPMQSNFPELSCINCHALFHPKCVGLMDGINYGNYDFYCYSCTPPAGKENSEPTFKKTPVTPGQLVARNKSLPGQDLTTIAPSLPLSTTLSTASPRPTQASTAPAAGAMQKPQNFMAKKRLQPKVKRPFRPLESQSVINIGGIKYLVVPHNQPGSSNNSHPPKSPSANSTGERLPILLKPAQTESGTNPDLPSFEVRETSEGKLLLSPVPNANNTPFKNPFKKMTISQGDKSYPVEFRFAGTTLHSNLSNAYFGLLHVFKYLTIEERVKVSRVCKLWREMALHPSLWHTISLANCQIINWEKFGEHLHRTQTSRVDFKKMLIQAGQEELWIKSLTSVTHYLQNVTQIEFQRIQAHGLQAIVQSMSKNPLSKLTGVIAQDVVCGSAKDQTQSLDLAPFCDLKNFAKIKLRSFSGSLKFNNLTLSLAKFTEKFTDSLKILSLLNVESLSDDHLSLISQFTNLDLLELGNCSRLLPSSYQGLAALKKLTRLRLECGQIGDEIGSLDELTELSYLELIDFQLKIGFGSGFIKLKTLKKILLIPHYKDDVAHINAEIVDAVGSMGNVSHFFFGLTNEWLETVNTKPEITLSTQQPQKIAWSIPILIKDKTETYLLSKLSKTLANAMPNASRVKVLKMSKMATSKQYISKLKQ